MSLTSHLRDAQSPIRRFLHDHFPNTRDVLQECRVQMVHATTTKPNATLPSSVYGLLGAALDYRARYYFAVTPCSELVAWEGASEATGGHLMYDSMIRMPFVIPSSQGWAEDQFLESEAVADFFTSLQCEIQDFAPVNRRLGPIQECRLARYCIILALFETVYRSGIQWPPLYIPETKHTAEKFLAIPDQLWVDDLCEMSWAFHDHFDHFLEKSTILNPTFDGSGSVGGADADMIVDGSLIEIKATINPRVKSEWLYQLLGYTLLDYSDRYRIRSIALYMARQQVTLQWPLDTLMTVMAGGNVLPLHQVRDEFREVASKYQKQLSTER